MAEQVRRAPQAYLNNLLLDRGLFSGFAARTFFQSMMSRHLGRRLLAAAGRYPARVQPPEQIGFATFYELTGVDLVITGVNISKGIPAMFSRRLTPDFPVVDAVTIFMSLPILFKPAYVEAEVPVTAFNPDPQAYQGFWVDGGVLNNVPMYAFDDNFTAASKASTLAPLNPQVVGLRLTPGAPGQPPPPFADPASTGLGIFLKGMAETLLYPSEQGQLLTCAEIEQTIDLHTYDLQLTEFAPPPSQSAEPIANAERSVLGYFNPGLH
ncbi:patatin-like phospholipase family protein [Nonomuraea glycinis]|uniref:PNPLA domain-containing protein n=1 Tax=Nonomuraea glycinis TaxID=2047744 RepID=A0A918E5S8_9ACTN|nr:patatin-like phospholipase family protein [Nonomuraea glycinis]MCA2178185.1 patatin-like phospholipase family protein [Nonomuraea glycinis]GGP05905.1 hypothetical protein GCM10012278_27160 [Nonomuraea glycinis]